MGTQLIFVVESNQQVKSDWIYIKSTIEHFYCYNRSEIKLSPVYMGGKGNYDKNNVVKKIEALKKQYVVMNKENASHVIYCFDCDAYGASADDKDIIKKSKEYCESKSFKYVWFCMDIEDVFWKKRVSKNQKKEFADKFARKNQIAEVDDKVLSCTAIRQQTSNLMKVLDIFLNKKSL